MTNKPYHLLNNILSQLKNSTEKKPVRPIDVHTTKQYNEISDRDRTIIFEKLERDGYISQRKMPKDVGNETEWIGWYITFDGIIFLDSGGYVQHQINKTLTESTIKKMQNDMLHLTLVLAVCGLIASLYYLKELFCK